MKNLEGGLCSTPSRVIFELSHAKIVELFIVRYRILLKIKERSFVASLRVLVVLLIKNYIV